MKTAIYIEDGVTQLVITPESEFEKNALTTLREKRIDAKLFAGSFFDCRGGWVRQSAYQRPSSNHWDHEGRDDSLMIRVSEREPHAPLSDDQISKVSAALAACTFVIPGTTQLDLAQVVSGALKGALE